MNAPSDVHAAGSWSSAVAALLAHYGLVCEPGVCLVMGCGLWFARERVESISGQSGAPRARLLNPVATETLAAALHAPLIARRRADAGQWYWLARRARQGLPTLIKLARVPGVDAQAELARDPLFALVQAVEPTEDPGARPGAPPPEELRLELDFGASWRGFVTLRELLPCWLDARDRELTAESYALLPPRWRPGASALDWPGALLRQTHALAGSVARALRRWSDELQAGAADPAELDALALSLGPDGSGSGRDLYAGGLEQLGAAAAARSWRAAQAAWRDLALGLFGAGRSSPGALGVALRAVADAEAHAIGELRLLAREVA